MLGAGEIKHTNNPKEYLKDGYAGASLNYRLSQHALFPAQLEDVKAAVRWLRANAETYRLDPNRFAAWGSSAGGHLVAMLGTTGDVAEFEVGENLKMSSRVQAVVDYFGPTDFLQMDAQSLPDGLVHDAPDSPESQLVGGPIQEHQDRVARANPITYVSKGRLSLSDYPWRSRQTRAVSTERVVERWLGSSRCSGHVLQSGRWRTRLV